MHPIKSLAQALLDGATKPTKFHQIVRPRWQARRFERQYRRHWTGHQTPE